MAELLLGATAFLPGIWNYNRSVFQTNAGQRQKAVYQLQNMQMSKVGMFREDVRDLMGLATQQMDSYKLLATLFAGFTATYIWELFFSF